MSYCIIDEVQPECDTIKRSIIHTEKKQKMAIQQRRKKIVRANESCQTTTLVTRINLPRGQSQSLCRFLSTSYTVKGNGSSIAHCTQVSSCGFVHTSRLGFKSLVVSVVGQLMRFGRSALLGTSPKLSLEQQSWQILRTPRRSGARL